MALKKLAAIEVVPDLEWNDTGLFLEKDTIYQISAAGLWTHNGITCGPDGYLADSSFESEMHSSADLRQLPETQTWFSLIAMISAERPFEIKYTFTFKSPVNGLIFLASNAPKSMRDSSTGSVTAVIYLARS